MFNAGVRGKRAKDSTGLITVGEHFNQQNFLIPNVTRFAVTDGSYVDTNDTAADTTGGQTIVLYGSGFAPGATILVGSTTIGAVTFLDSGRLAFSSPALGSGSYTIFVTNANGGTGILVPGLVYSGVPTFTTAAGSLGSVYETTAINTTVVATGDEPITYAISSGSLPPGSTLSSGGTISGTAPVDGSSTTYSFTIQATDADNQDSVRSFNLTIDTDVVSFSSPANNTLYGVTQNTAISNVTVTATSAAGYGVLYTSSGLPTGLSMNTSTGIISGTPTIRASNVSIITATANTTNRNASLYLNWTINLPGDLFWKYTSLLLSANTVPNGNTFNTDLSTFNNEVVVFEHTKPSEFHPFKEGYYSNYFDGNGDYLTAPSSAAFAFGTGNFTIEFWAYPTVNARQDWIDFDNGGGYRLLIYYNGTNIIYYSGGARITGSAMTLNTWQHIAVVRNSGSTKLYINGNQSGSTYTDSINFLAQPLTIGKDGAGSTVITGYMSNVRVVKGTALYTSAFTPPTGPLTYVANTVLLTCQSNKLIDNSNNNFTITKNGDTTVSPFSPFNGTPTTVTVPDANNYSVFFDGTDSYLIGGNAGPIGTEDFTWECYAYISTMGGDYPRIFESNTGASGSFQVYLSGGTLTVGGNGTGTITSYSIASLTNQWLHLCITRTGSAMRLFVNGVLRGYSASGGNNFSSGGSVWRSSNEAGGIIGYLSNMRVVRGSVVTTYSTSSTTTGTTIFTTPTSPLTAISGTQFLGMQSSTMIDNSANAYTITTTGDARPARNGPFANTTTVTLVGNEGSAYFDGTGDFLSITNNSAYTLGTNDFTIESWIYRTDTGVQRAIVDNSASQGNRILFYITTNNKLNLFDGTNTWLTSNNTISANQWVHVAVARSSGTTKLFINGIQEASSTDSRTYTNGSAGLYVGKQFGSTTNDWAGYISNLRIIKGTALYTSAFVPTWSPLTPVANTVLLTAQTNSSSNTKSFVDESNFNNIITPTGNTALGSFTPFSSTWSGYFDGTTDYLTTTASAANQMTGDFTVELWIHPTSVPAQVGLIGINNTSSSGGANFALYIASDRRISFFIAGNSTSYTSTNVVITVGVWQHIAFVRSGSTNTVYVDGVSVLTNSATPSWSGSPAITVGRLYADNTAVNFYGYISNVRVLKGTAVYTDTFTPPTTPLTSVANTVFLSCNSNRFVDYSAANNVITRTGNASVSRFSPFSSVTVTPASYSGYFDGNGDYLSIPYSTLISQTGPYTLEFWFYPTYNYSGQYIFAQNGGGAFGLNWTGTVMKVDKNGVGVQITGTTTMGLNQWHHYAMTYDGTTTRVFANGTLDGSVSGTGGLANVPTTIGYYEGNSSSSYRGYISNFRFVSGTAVYTGNFTPPTDPLTAIANTSLLTCQSTTFIDNSNNAFAITINGDAKPVIQNPFTDTVGSVVSYSANTFGSSIFFDNYAAASRDYLSVSGIPISATGQFTFEAWLYTTTVNNSNNGMIYSQYTTSNANRWTIVYTTSNKIQVTHPSRTVIGATTFPPYQWNHVAVTRDSSNTLRIFLNGVVDATSSSYTYSIMQSPPRVGYYNNTPNDYWNGFMSSVRVVNGQALYTTPFIPSNQPLPPTSNTTLLLASTVGPSVTDATRNHNIETFGTARYVANNAPYYDTYSGYFDGNGDYLSVPANAAFAFGTGDYTLEFWVYSSIAWASTICLYNNNSGGYFLQYATGTGLQTGVAGSSATGTYAVTLTSNNWNHIAVSRASGSSKCFVNGTQVGTTVTDNTNYAQNGAYIGALYNGSQPLTGYISNLRVVKGTALYTTTFTPSTTPLTAIANTQLLTCQSNSFIDNSTNAFTITKFGDAKITTLQPFAANNTSRFSSVYFAAKTDYLAIEPDPNIVRFPGDFTFECWVYPTLTTTTFWGIWDSRNAGATANPLAFSLDPLASAVAGSYRMSYYNGTKYYGTTTVLWNQWTHVAWVRSGTTMTFYVNGVAGGTATISGAQIGNVTSTPIYIGSKDNNLTNYGTNGYISDLRITNGYARTITVPTTPYDIK